MAPFDLRAHLAGRRTGGRLHQLGEGAALAARLHLLQLRQHPVRDALQQPDLFVFSAMKL